MINLDDNVRYFIMIDGQGRNFGQGRIFEGIKELVEQFQDWASVDEYEDPTLKDWSIIDCLDNWQMTLKVYDSERGDFEEIHPSFDKEVYDFKIK